VRVAEPTIGAYKVLRKIGEGGMGAVFLGEHTLLGRKAAIKVLLPSLTCSRRSASAACTISACRSAANPNPRRTVTTFS
jgi:hypothetical protein